MKSKRELLLTGNINNLLFKFSAPAIIGMIVGALYNIIDTIFIGKGVGTLAIAALSIVLPIQFIMMAIGVMIGIGSGSIISRSMGRNRKDIAISAAGNGIILTFFFNFLFITFSYIFIDKLLVFFGASGKVLPYAVEYASIILLGSVFFSFSISSNNFMRAEGSPRAAMYAMVIGAASNIVLDPVLIFIFNMGIKGAAIATIIGQILSSIYILCYFSFGKSIFRISLSMFRIKFNIMKEIVCLGFPSFLGMVAGSVVILVFNRVLLYYGSDLYIAVMGIGIRLVSLIQLPIAGIAQGFSTIAGFNYGARLFSRVKKVLGAAMLWSAIFAGIGFVIIMLFPGFVMSFFSSDSDLISKGILPIRIVIIFLPLIGVQALGGGLFQAIGKATPALIITILRQILFLIPAVLVLPLFFGLRGVWMSMPVSDFLSILIASILIWREIGKFNKSIVSQGQLSV